jgi:uncharacterized protein with HEPN domain
MSKRSDQAYLLDIVEAIHWSREFVEGLSYEAFLADKKSQDAVIRNLEIIGEATKQLSGEIRAENGQIPWRKMAGLRDRLIHDYFGVNIDIVWQIVSVDLLPVATQIEQLLNDP